MTLFLATQNPNKITELKQLLAELNMNIVTPDSDEDVEETGSTFAENARLKAKFWQEKFPKHLILAEDSGLCVDALDGQPGVYSKRFGNDDTHRIQKLLAELHAVPHSKRAARFVTVATLLGTGIDREFEGVVEGRIALQTAGSLGFGYDPIFIPAGYEQTFAELGNSVKHALSHRAKAVRQVAEFLKLKQSS